jgi:hypothetical protein
MTAQVFLKLSSKLAAEQGVVGDLDGAADSGHGSSSNAIHSEDAVSYSSHKYTLSGSTARGLSFGKKLRNGSKERSKKKPSGSSTSSTM